MIRGNFYETRPNASSSSPSLSLVLDGKSSDLTIDAAQLLAQYKTSLGDFLLVFDDDCPAEEMLYFVLLRDEKILDQLSYGAPYTPGIFKEHPTTVNVEENKLRFTFASDDVIELNVHASPSRWRKSSAPGSHHRSVLGEKYLTLNIFANNN
jgi:hypothetical protein